VQGTPETIAAASSSFTGSYLRQIIAAKPARTRVAAA
jgi:excinuclease UvrABC ATPase subunit